MERRQVLLSVAPFNSLTPDEMDRLIPKLKEKTFPKGTFIFKQGKEATGFLYLIVEGLAEIIVTNEVGVESVVGLRKENQFFGETVIMTGKAYPASVKAVEDLRCLLLSAADFEDLLHHNVHFAGYFTQLLADRLRDLYDEVLHEQSYESYGMDSQPFRKRVCDVMSSPVVTCPIDSTIVEVAKTMMEKKLSSLVVTGPDGRVKGIVTERDLVHKVLTQPGTVATLAEVMNPNITVLPPDAWYYQALLIMVRGRHKHVLVKDGAKLLGMVTMRDLILARSTGALTIVDGIEHRSDFRGLAEAVDQVDKILQAMVAEKAEPEEIFAVISELYDRLTIRVIEVALEEMEKEGHGKPPVPFCWITMGSSGRKEQTHRTDQDNGIIFQDVPKEQLPAVQEYFHRFAYKVVEGLAQCGFEKCKGDVMATNPMWRRPLGEWSNQIHNWVATPEPESIRLLTIFLDFRPVYGERELADELKRSVTSQMIHSPIVFYHLAKDDMSHKVPLGLFNNFLTEKTKEHKDELDLKRSVCVHVVDCIRIFAYRDNIPATSTLDRLRGLAERGTFSKDDADLFETAYKTIMSFRIRENLRKEAQGKEADNYINPYKLTKREQSILKESIRAVGRLQNLTGTVFRVD